MNEVIKQLLSHRSIRAYQDKPVEKEQLEKIINAVQSAPSWINGQQVSVIAVKDPERKKKFSELCGGQKHVAEAPVFLVFCADFYRTYLASQMENKPLHITDNIDTLVIGATDVGIALEAAITAAESLGLGTVAIGGVRRNISEVSKELNLPPYVIPISGLCIGYPAEKPELKPRLPKEAVYHEETYNHEIQKQIEEYNDTYTKYVNSRTGNNHATKWSEAVANFYSQILYQGIEEGLAQQKMPHTKK